MKIAVLLSGGVDSSVALRLAKEAGAHEVTVFYLKIWLEDELAYLGECPWQEDLEFARAVCEQAGVPLEVVPLQDEYQSRIVTHALTELKAGRTPSPDIHCNQWIKFGLFLERTGANFDQIVTGHYAQIEQQGDLYFLKRSPDAKKDQSYFLSRLTQAQLSRLWFPVGGLRKSEVRRLAMEWDLPNRARPDSQGICFLGKIKYPSFVAHHLGKAPGEIVDIDSGKILGTHQGVWFHTIGQRKGLSLGGGPWYVVSKDLTERKVFVSHADRHLEHARREFSISNVHWVTLPPQRPDVLVKVRHGPHLHAGCVEPRADGRWHVMLEEKDPGLAPGQSAVFYDDMICLGTGIIELP